MSQSKLQRKENTNAEDGEQKSEISHQVTQRVATMTMLDETGKQELSKKTPGKKFVSAQFIVAIALTMLQTIFVLMSLLPQTYAARLGWSSTDGPFPTSIVPVVAAIYYVTPVIIGFLCKRWETALILATLPAWIGVGLFTIGASTHNGVFAMTSSAQPSYTVGMLELFAALGALGWILHKNTPSLSRLFSGK